MKLIWHSKETRKDTPRASRLEWLLYVPGAMILCYGLWLSLTVTPGV